MAFRALLFSKSAETNTAITAACKSAGIHVEVRSDIFTAIDQAKTRAFSCLIVDWADQPEATFLLKRARESGSSRDTVSVAIVDHDPTAGEMHDNRLDFLIYRPISAEDAKAVFAKAREKMQPSGGDDDEMLSADRDSNEVANSTSAEPDVSNHFAAQEPSGFFELDASIVHDAGDATTSEHEGGPRERSGSFALRAARVALLLLTVGFCVWRSRDAGAHLSQSSQEKFRSLRDSVVALFSHPPPKLATTTSLAIDPKVDADLGKEQSSNVQTTALGLVAATSTLTDAPMPLPKASDFPLPTPVFEHPAVAPIRVQRAAIPESMRNSPPIAPPLVVTVSPAQMMPISIAQSQPSLQQTSEPVVLSEDVERALLIHTVNPIYPPEALPQKLHGQVVLQAMIGRDGTVVDLKIVRGYFVLGKAAIAAVKQWQFQPYTINGHPASTQTVITVNFTYPPG
jgi:TonB family protein